jgi:hypothetical protein
MAHSRTIVWNRSKNSQKTYTYEGCFANLEYYTCQVRTQQRSPIYYNYAIYVS